MQQGNREDTRRRALDGPNAGEGVNTISASIQNKVMADDSAMFQMGTYPAVTTSLIAYQIVIAAEMVNRAMQ